VLVKSNDFELFFSQKIQVFKDPEKVLVRTYTQQKELIKTAVVL
jgi:hypothetical protein